MAKLTKTIHSLLSPFNSLQNNPTWRRLYIAETISLLGDTFTWVGIALLAYAFGGLKQAATILAIALTLRVTAFIIFSPIAGVIADRLDRKKILYITHIFRTIIVGLLPFVHSTGQIYVLIFLLNIFNAFFTPTFQAVIPQVVEKKENYASAIGLFNATYQLLGVLGPGCAGVFAAWLGAREVFFVDAASFIIAAILIFSLHRKLRVNNTASDEKEKMRWVDIPIGTRLLFKDPVIRFALLMELVAAIAGAQILVNTVGYVKGGLGLGDAQYGWVMAAFGIGASIAAFLFAWLDKRWNRIYMLISGAAILTFAIFPANFFNLIILLILWLLTGIGQSLIEIPAQTFIADRIPADKQGKVYGAHFAWSHLWWAIAYPVAGLSGHYFTQTTFLYGAILTFIVLVVVCLFFLQRFKKNNFIVD